MAYSCHSHNQHTIFFCFFPMSLGHGRSEPRECTGLLCSVTFLGPRMQQCRPQNANAVQQSWRDETAFEVKKTGHPTATARTNKQRTLMNNSQPFLFLRIAKCKESSLHLYWTGTPICSLSRSSGERIRKKVSNMRLTNFFSIRPDLTIPLYTPFFLVKPMAIYYVLHGNIFQCPDLQTVLSNRVVCETGKKQNTSRKLRADKERWSTDRFVFFTCVLIFFLAWKPSLCAECLQ